MGKKNALQKYLTNIIIRVIHLKCLIIFIIIFFNITEIYAQNAQQDSTNINDSIQNKKKISLKSPQGAMIRSLIFPGLGQFYNGKKFKALIFFCGEFGLAANSIYLNQQYKKSKDELAKEFYIENRNISTWWLVGSILYSMLDAYVDAQLSDFDESPDLSLHLEPQNGNLSIFCKLSFSF